MPNPSPAGLIPSSQKRQQTHPCGLLRKAASPSASCAFPYPGNAGKHIPVGSVADAIPGPRRPRQAQTPGARQLKSFSCPSLAGASGAGCPSRAPWMGSCVSREGGTRKGRRNKTAPPPIPKNGFMRLPRGRDKKRAGKQDRTPSPIPKNGFMRLSRGRDKQRARKQDRTPPIPTERFHAPPKRQGPSRGQGQANVSVRNSSKRAGSKRLPRGGYGRRARGEGLAATSRGCGRRPRR